MDLCFDLIENVPPNSWTPAMLKRLFGSQMRRHQPPQVDRTLEALLADGLHPADETDPDDIFIIGFPKSGHTWCQQLVGNLIFGLDLTRAPFALVDQVVPDLDARRYYRRFATPMVFKTHHEPQERYRRVVYLLRDGRDAMVSYRHYQEVVDQAPLDFKAFASAEAAIYPCPWSRHVEEWTANPFGAQMIIVRYEDLVADTTGQLRRICDFAGLQRTCGQLADAIDATAFPRLQRKEAAEGVYKPRLEAKTAFFRRGEIGSYKDEMEPDVLEVFLGHAGPTLRRFGYINEQ